MHTDKSSAEDDPVLITVEDRVMTIVINRPAARNAVNAGVTRGIGDALESAHSDPEVAVVVLTGAGDLAFCSGADLKARARGESLLPADGRFRHWGFAGMTRHPIDKPIISAVNGPATGGGVELILAADLALAASHATFALPEVRIGALAGAGALFRLSQQIPPKAAMAMLLTGEPIDADTAVGLGLANQVVPGPDLRAAAMDLALRIAANAPLAIRASKRLVRGIRGRTIPDEEAAWAASDAELALIRTSNDLQEGRLAFLQKRTPCWTGH